jgi:hypothetical protein
MDRLKLLRPIGISFALLIALVPAGALADEWWYGSYVSEYDTETLLKQGHSRPFDCEKADHGPRTYDSRGSRTRQSECKYTKVTKIPGYEVVILESMCERWVDDMKYPPAAGTEMLLRLEPEGRVLAYHPYKIGRHHLPSTNEMSACRESDQ